MIRRGALATFRGAAAASRGARGNNSSKAWFSSTAVPEQERENEQNNKVASSSKAAPKARQSPAAPLKFDMDSFPSLLDRPDPVLDSGKAFYNEPSSTSAHKSSVIFYNSPRYFEPTRPTAASLILSGSDDGGDEVDSAAYLSTVTPLTSAEVNNLYRHTLTVKRVVRMTGKGKQPKMASLVVAGNGRGLVGYGEGKDLNAGKASRKAFHEAVKTLDYVERYDGRTIPAEVRGKWGATTVTLRPRPAGEPLLLIVIFKQISS
ncbi:hypothetical protein L7F22_069432 [Adiantum nelumboides]|nr:hypothetical protein [Adiantum nelumboides]